MEFLLGLAIGLVIGHQYTRHVERAKYDKLIADQFMAFRKFYKSEKYK